MTRHMITFLFTVLLVLTGAACSTTITDTPLSNNFKSIDIRDYRLNTGDEIKVTVFGEQDLSGVYKIDGIGRVALPLVGDVIIRDQTVSQAEANITQAYLQDYLKDPNITVQVMTYRPFYILGEVKQPGSYSYVDGMTVLNAVALGGGFTYRANKRQASIKRQGDRDQPFIFDSAMDTPVLPDDIIEIDERFF